MDAPELLGCALLVEKLRKSCDYVQKNYHENPYLVRFIDEHMEIAKITRSTWFYTGSLWKNLKPVFIRMIDEDDDLSYLILFGEIYTRSWY